MVSSQCSPAIVRRRLPRNVRRNLVAMAILSLIGFVWVYPFLWTISVAFKTQLGAFSAGASLIPHPIELGNFARAWVVAGFGMLFLNTVLYASGATLIELIKSAMCGYVLARYEFPGRTLLYRLVIATLFVPIATVIIPQFLLVERLGLLNTRAGVILALSGGAGALYVLLFTNFFKSVPQELFDAASLDGASFPQTFRLILPLARPIIAVVVIFQFIQAWNDFNVPLVYTIGQPSLQNLAVGMFAFQGAHSLDWTGFAAATVISFVPILIVFFAFQGYFVRGLAGAVKG
ncbi:MAG TPA: carbohydrate ABC transporter permease [Dehalococcoidia bacterium]|nr:carbohydrate ABC transporter permease [Dehalococcoidia bacterium]